MCFMFMGVFPHHHEIRRSKLINLWDADGFLGLDVHKFPDRAVECLQELASNSMVMIYKSIIKSTWAGRRRDIKTCRVHPSMWHLSNREGTRSKFSYVLNTLADALEEEEIKGQHRLSFHNNVLFGIKDVRKSVEDICVDTAHSLLCYGSYLQYQVSLCFGLLSLRELDALTIRFYEFPVEILALVQLRYLALTLNGKLPAAISQLSTLRFLVVDQHQRIKFCEGSSYLPMEIWSLKELQHLQVMGNDLPDPCGSASLESLSKLSSVGPDSCTSSVFRAIPNLKKLGIQVELAPDSDGEPLISCIGRVSHLRRLESLKCVVVNPKAVPNLAPLPTNFPVLLTKLSLSGLGYAWEEMSKNIASMISLNVLKLRNYAFRGAEWEVRKGEFLSLQSLVIEDTDLVKWKIGRGSLFVLNCLVIKRCSKLKEVRGEFGQSVKQIGMVDCNPLGAEQMKKAASTQVRLSCSWYDHKSYTFQEMEFSPHIFHKA